MKRTPIEAWLLTPIALALATCATFAPRPALAQTAQAADTAGATAQAAQTVTVTGIRSSLNRARNEKKDSTQFVDAIFAEDIGKLPDTNVAESLARVSGVQLSQGIGGEGTSITIRGSRDNVVLLNGRQVIDVAGRGGQGLDTLGSTSYGILSIIPSELIYSLKVTKLPGADEIEGGLGGTVNIVTARPLDLKRTVMAGSLEGGYRRYGNTGNRKVSLLYSTLNEDSTFGVLANVVHTKLEVREDSFSSFLGYQPLTAGFNTGNTTGVRADPNGDGVFGSRIADLRYQTLEEERERLGLTTTLQWRPSAAVELLADVSYMKTTVGRDRSWLAVPISGSGADWRAVTMTPDEYIVGGTQLTRLTTNYERMELSTDLGSAALAASWQGERTRLSGEVAYSRSRGRMNQWAGVLTTVNRQTVSFDYAGGDIPSVSISATDLGAPATFIWTNVQENRRPSEASDKALRLDLEHEVGWGPLTSLQMGARFNETYFDFQPSNNSVTSTPGATTPGFNTPATQTPGLLSTFSAPNFLGGANVPATFLTPSVALTANGCRTFDANYNAAQRALCTPDTPTALAVSTVTEKFGAGYLKANFNARLGTARLEGNAGVRYVKTDLESEGFTRYVRGGVGTLARNAVSDSRTDVLPSVVAKLTLPNGLVLRAGAAQVIARPATSLLNSSFTINETTSATGATVFSASGGNPKLKPYEVNQVDLAGEFYFGRNNFAAVNLFYKDVNTYFVRETRPEVVEGVNGNQPINVTRTNNAFDAKVKGIELVLQQEFDFLPAAFKGLGAQISYSRIESETPTVDPTTRTTLPLPGLSKNNANIVLFYETPSFGVRAALTTRDRYFDSIGTNQAGVYYDKYSSLSLSAWVDVAKGIKLRFSGSNLTNEPVRIFAGQPEYVKQHSLASAIYALSLSARF